jgi:hypothetical protein
LKLTKRLVTGIELWKLYFQIRARCALTSAFDKIAGTKKIAGKHFFLQATLFIEKIADDENLSSYLSQGDGGLKKNNRYLIKLVRE